MSERGLPPFPTTRDWRAWATQLVEFLISEGRSEEFVAPRAVSLLHQIPPVTDYKPLEDGLMMFDPSLGVPVYSNNNQWNQFTAQGNLNYLVTDNAGNGTVVDDINNTDFTGQTGAVGQCAQCPVATEIAFYHKGVQYLYTGPTPASYGAGCADTMQDSYLIPVGTGTFLALTDTPDSYQAQADKWPRVNASANALVFDVIEEADITNLSRVRWRGNWVQQQYEKNDMVLADANWLMIANKQTSEVAPPRPVGDPQWDMPDFPTWATNQFTGVVRSGREWEFEEPVDVRGFEIWVPTLDANTNYTVFAYKYPKGQPDQLTAVEIGTANLTAGTWSTVSLNRTTFTANTTLGIYIDALNSGSDTLVTGGWSRAANNNTLTVDPGTGAWGTNNAETSIRINYTDLDTTDRTSELQGIVPGTTFEAVQTNDTSKSINWVINGAGVDRTTHISFDNLSVSDYGPNGPPDIGATCTLSITIPVPSPTDYVQIAGGNPTHTWGTSRGLLSFDGVAQVVPDDAFGVRVLVDEYVVPVDWDIASAVGSGGGGGGGSGGATTFTQLGDTPAAYAGQAGKAAIVNQGESGLEFETIQSGATIGDAFPPSPFVGQLHYKTDPQIALYIYYDDGDSQQWVSVTGGGMFELSDQFLDKGANLDRQVVQSGVDFIGTTDFQFLRWVDFGNTEFYGMTSGMTGDGNNRFFMAPGDGAGGAEFTREFGYDPTRNSDTGAWYFEHHTDFDSSLDVSGAATFSGSVNAEAVRINPNSSSGASSNLRIIQGSNSSGIVFEDQNDLSEWAFQHNIGDSFVLNDYDSAGSWTANRMRWESQSNQLEIRDHNNERQVYISGSNVATRLEVGENGPVALTLNDGYGNCNLTFNHTAGIPDQNGTAARIVVGTDNTGGNVQIQLNNSVTSGVAVACTDVATWFQNSVRFPKAYSNTGTTGGNLRVSSDGTLMRESSSSKYKTDIQTLSVNEGQFDALRPVTFMPKDPNPVADPNHPIIGFITEEVAAVYPNAIEVGDENYDTRSLVAILVDEVQKLRKRVKELEEKERVNTSLREEINRLWAAMPGSHGRGH